MKSFEAEFAIFDVFNVLHSADENDNSEMRRVLQRLSQLQAEVGCGIGVVHHYSKASDPGLPLTQRLRGAGAIAGWCEWLTGMSMADIPSKVRCMEFDIEADNPPPPVYFTIDSSDEHNWAKLTRVDYAQTREAGHSSGVYAVTFSRHKLRFYPRAVDRDFPRTEDGTPS